MKLGSKTPLLKNVPVPAQIHIPKTRKQTTSIGQQPGRCKEELELEMNVDSFSGGGWEARTDGLQQPRPHPGGVAGWGAGLALRVLKQPEFEE